MCIPRGILHNLASCCAAPQITKLLIKTQPTRFELARHLAHHTILIAIQRLVGILVQPFAHLRLEHPVLECPALGAWPKKIECYR